MTKLNAIDLFAGAGGLSEGINQAGINVLLANEINQDACLTYVYNHPKTIINQEDIRKVNGKSIKNIFGGIDVVAGGPPCQGFSLAGKRDPKDPRNKMFKEFHRVIKELKPNTFVMENVKGLLSFQKGEFVNKIVRHFENIGYNVTVNLLNASDFGVPQQRERVFIIGNVDGKISLDLVKKCKEKVTTKQALSDLEFLNSGEEINEYKFKPQTNYQKLMRLSNKLTNHKASNHSAAVIERFSKIKPGKGIKSLPLKYQTSKNVLFRLNPELPSRTVTTLPEDLIHYSKNRILTVREMARLQSFNDKYLFLGPRTTGGDRRKYSCPQYTQVGNAVPPILSKIVFSTINGLIS